MSDIIPEGILYGNLGVGSGTTNYNDLDNKPQINSVTLQGNKTASELGLVGTADIPVTSVNGETGAVVLDGTEINYQTGKTINQKIDEVEAEIPVISYPVTSVNGETGAVVLDGTDIEYSSGVSVNSQIDTLMNYTPVYGNTASGAIATFDTSLALPLQDLQIAINAVQASGASFSDPKAISGFTGANIYKHNKNLICKVITGASVSSAGEIISHADYDMCVAYIKEGVTYTGKSNTTPLVGAYYDTMPDLGSISIDGTRFIDLSATFTATQDCFIAFRCTTGYQSQLEIGLISTDYVTPQTSIIYVSWQSEAEIVY